MAGNQEGAKKREKNKKRADRTFVGQHEGVLLLYLDSLRKHLEEFSKQQDLKNWDGKEQCRTMPFTVSHPQYIIDRGLEYLEKMIEYREMPTLSGIIMWCGYHRQTFKEMAGEKAKYGYKGAERTKGHDDFKYPIYMLTQFISMVYELRGGEKQNSAFEIFLLKNMGMEERQVIEDESNEAFDPEKRQKMRNRLKNMMSNESAK